MDIYDDDLLQRYAHQRHDEEIRNAAEARLRHGLTHPTGQHGMARPVILLGGLVAAGTMIAAFTLTGGAEAPTDPVDPRDGSAVRFEDTGSSRGLNPCVPPPNTWPRYC